MPDLLMTPDQFLDHWQGHRRLTRRTIAAFPDDAAFATFAVGGMRPFAELSTECRTLAVSIARGVATDAWDASGWEAAPPTTRAEALRLWDEATAEIDRSAAAIPARRFQETMTAFGQFTGPGYWHLAYALDNEIHHRAQGTVYLRALGVAPPPFYDRS